MINSCTDRGSLCLKNRSSLFLAEASAVVFYRDNVSVKGKDISSSLLIDFHHDTLLIYQITFVFPMISTYIGRNNGDVF